MFTPYDLPDYDLLRLQAKERAYHRAEQRRNALNLGRVAELHEQRAHEDEVADGLLSEPDRDPDWNEEVA